MRNISYRPYVGLLLFFLCVLSLPQGVSERLRSVAIASFSPGWRGLNYLFSSSSFPEKEHLLQENHLLRAQMQSVREWLLNEERLQKQIERYQFFSSQKSDFFKRRAQELKEALELQLCSLPARVIFRQPASWSSSVWINVGERDNQRLHKAVVCKNSPVVLGSSIVGVIEYVGTSRSRVRLITDASLAISVRSVRGEAYLAKGELKGSSAPLWRSRGSVLQGRGFNYDFPDAEGPARDLRSGEPYGSKAEAVRLLQCGDLLVTTGLDGLFPAGFQVATVSSVQMLKEGASAYEIQAIPTAPDLEELSHLFVLPPYNGET